MSLAPDARLAVLRVVCGLWLLPHVVGKLRNLKPAAGTFEKAGFRPGPLFVRLTIVLELLAAGSLAFGLYPRVGAGLAALVLLGAAFAVVRINGFNWRWQKQGPEYMLLWAFACIVSVL